MYALHVFVRLASAAKRLHAEPADVYLARGACHVIATIRFLDRHPALWAVSYIMVFLPFRELLVFLYGSSHQSFVGLTSLPVMGSLAAASADRGEAAVAIKDSRVFSA